MTEKRKRSPIRKLRRRLAAARKGAENAAILLKQGRLGAPYRAPYDIIEEGAIHRLRHYRAVGGEPHVKQSLLFVPPLMVSSEIYDISPELSAVAALQDRGIDVWLVDFGAPEDEEDGLRRTLEDHILAVASSIERAAAVTGHDVHVAGYSQGGMFAYQAAAYLRSKDIASLVTFGAPVDIWRNLPVKVNEEVTGKMVEAAGAALAPGLKHLSGLPATLTSTGFKVFSAQKEVKQIASFFGLLHDRDALLKREPSRRFLGGEGFVAWPGPAFRQFVDQVIVQNRMKSGGLVMGGRSTSLGDITCPVLALVGTRDDMARPAAVRGITDAAPQADVHLVDVAAGHFGLVVGSTALTRVWPLVGDWVTWRAGQGEEPADLHAGEPLSRTRSADPAGGAPPADSKTSALYDMATDVLDGWWHRAGDLGVEISSVVDAMRWQLPRLAKLEELMQDPGASMSATLAEQAEAIGDETFFLWKGRAYTYANADARVNQIARALKTRGIGRGSHVGVLLPNHPDYLTLTTALNRLGAVAVLLNSGLRGSSLEQALDAGAVRVLVTDITAEGLGTDRELDIVPLATLSADADDRSGEPIEELDPTRIDDTAMLMFTSGTTGLPKAARITNRRLVSAALGAAAACRLGPRDTVYCALPLYHATGMLIAVGGALAGGSRLALAGRFSTSQFWTDVRRVGASVVFYVGELCRYLVNTPVQPGETKHPVRLFAGNGMRADVWERLLARFGDVQVLEFYGSTEGNVALANLTGEKVGCVGRPLTSAEHVALLVYDVEQGAFVRDGNGRYIRCDVDQPGVLVARVHAGRNPLSRFDGYVDKEATQRKLLRDVMAPGDEWFVTGDLLRRDADGDYWFVDRLGDTYRWKGENVSSAQVTAVLTADPSVAMAAVYGIELPGREGRAGMAALELTADAQFEPQRIFEHVSKHLFPAARPRFVRLVREMTMTPSMKVLKNELQREGVAFGPEADPVFWYNEEEGTYQPLDEEIYARLTT
jgi:putative long chain acyl-CoA synthase